MFQMSMANCLKDDMVRLKNIAENSVVVFIHIFFSKYTLLHVDTKVRAFSFTHNNMFKTV